MSDVEALEEKAPAIEGLTDQEAAFVQATRDGLTFRKAAKAIKVDKTTVQGWLRRHPAFRAEYMQAKEDQADEYFEGVIDAAYEAGDPQDRRVRIDALKWAAGVRKPKVYGNKLEMSGSLDVNYSSLSDEDLRNRALAAIEKWGFFLAPLPSRSDHRDQIRDQALAIMREANNYLDAYDRLIEAGFIIVAPPKDAPKLIEVQAIDAAPQITAGA